MRLLQLFLMLLLFAYTQTLYSQSVGIGTNNPFEGAILDLNSNNKGLLIPRVEAGNVNDTTAGLLIFQPSNNRFLFHNGFTWESIGEKVYDSDGDTRIEAVNNSGNDALKFYLDGVNMLNYSRNAVGDLLVEPLNTTNTFFGTDAGRSSNNLLNYNTAIGNEALLNNISGIYNTAVGASSLKDVTSGSQNSAIGVSSLGHTNGEKNVTVGNYTLHNNTAGNNNVAFGWASGLDNNGSGNVFLGSESGRNETGSNKLYIENSGEDKEGALIYGEFDNDYLRINANQEVISLNSTVPTIKATKNDPSDTSTDTPAILGENNVQDGYGIGISGYGGKVGVQGQAGGSGFISYYGVRGYSASTNSGYNYGVFGYATGSIRNYAIYGSTLSNEGNNWAGYFEGKAYVQDSLKVNGSGHFNNGVLVNGNMGIGINIPEKNLHIFDGDDPTIKLQSNGVSEVSGRISLRQSNDSGMDMYYDGASDEMVFESFTDGNSNGKFFYIDQNFKRVGVGISPLHPLHMESGARCTTAGVWTDASDQRLKKEIKNVTYGLNEIMKLRPVAYKMKANDEDQIGFIAQEVREILPELISGKEGDIEEGETLGMAYGQLSSVIVKAMQEQQQIIEKQNSKIEELEKQLNSQTSEIELLKAGMAEMKAAIEAKTQD